MLEPALSDSYSFFFFRLLCYEGLVDTYDNNDGLSISKVQDGRLRILVFKSSDTDIRGRQGCEAEKENELRLGRTRVDFQLKGRHGYIHTHQALASNAAD